MDWLNIFNSKYNTDIYFEKDEIPAQRYEANKHLLKKLFSNCNWIQNHPNFTNFAYPIENLCDIIKPRVKRRNLKTIEDSKKYLLKEWNSVLLKMVRNHCKGYFKRIEKCMEINGGRITP